MKQLLKAFSSKLLFRNRTQKTFIPIRVSPSDINERVFLVSGGNKINVTQEHCIVCHSPFCIAVWSKQSRTSANAIEITSNGKTAAELDVIVKHEVEWRGNFVTVYEITKAKCKQLPYWHQYILLKRYFLRKKKDTFFEGMTYGATYSFPRRVIAVSYKDESYFNIFPMDFQCFVEKGNVIILGLRTTNTTLKKILESRRVVVSDTTSVDMKTIYDLGRNHSAAPPSLDQLPFKVITSEKLGFYVPEFSATYKELEIVNSIEIGTHTMMIGNLINSKRLREDASFVHHIHFFEFVTSHYTELN